MLLSSCVRNISPKGEHLLYRNVVKGNKSIETEKLEALLPQKPNRKFLFPGGELYLWLYQIGEKAYNKSAAQSYLTKLNQLFEENSKNLDPTSKEFIKLSKQHDKDVAGWTKYINEGNWFMRVLGEPPSYFTLRDAKQNEEKLQKYLKNKGFFEAKVSYKLDTVIYKRIRATFNIQENAPYLIKEITLDSADVAIDSLWRANLATSFLVKNERFDLERWELEKSRLEGLFKNNGYFYFTRNYLKISTTYDSSKDSAAKWCYPKIIILSPDQATHKSFTIGSMQFVVDKIPSFPVEFIDTIAQNNIQHFFINKRYNVKLLDAKLVVRPGQLYSRQNEILTQRRLFSLDQFRFVQPQYDSTGGKLNVRYYAVPLDKYQYTGEAGLSVFRYEPGPFMSHSFRIRNIFGGMESLEISTRIGYEAQGAFLQPDNIKNNLDVGISTYLNFPEILLPGKFRYRFNDSNPRTQLGVSYNFLDRQEYTRSNFRTFLQYSFQPSLLKTFQFSLLDLNLVNSNIRTNQSEGADFQAYLDTLRLRGNNLYRSFNKSFVSSISLSYLYNDNIIGKNQKSRFLRLFFESGGTTLNLLPNKEIGFLNSLFADLGKDLTFYRFLKFEADYRQYIPTGRKSSFVWRLHGGIAYSYDDSGELPYEKNFFVGGGNSLRAWQPRRLGPGSLIGVLKKDGSGQIDYRFEQPGSIIFEGSAEYRFAIAKLYGDLNGAFFLDIGNVWSTKENSINTTDNGTTQFSLARFYKELAVGTGFGIRYDFSFFIIRFDLGVKVYEPARPEGKRYVLKDFNLFNPGAGSNPMIFNIAIGYPF